MNPFRTALDLLARGLWPIPITAPDDPHALAPGKQPIGKGWGKVRHTPDSLGDVFATHPDAGVGLKLGPDGRVIDLDVDDPEKAAPVVARMFAGEVPETLGWSTARGHHHLFAWDDRLAKYGKAVVKGHPSYPGIDLRFGWSADGRQYQSVVPPSVGSDGQARRWNEHHEIRPLPESVFADLDRYLATPAGVKPPRKKLRVVQDDGTWSPEQRAIAYLARCEPAISGQDGHGRAFKAACKVGPGFDLSPDVAFRLLRDHYNPSCRPPWSDKELRHKVDEAFKVETRRGWLLERPKAEEPRAPGREKEKAVKEKVDDPHRLARLFLKRRASLDGEPTLRYWLEEWHRWDGSRYQVVPTNEIRAELFGSIKREFDRVASAADQTTRPVNTSILSNTLQALADLVLLPLHRCPAQPAWLGFSDEDRPDPREVIPARNGLVHLPALIEGRPPLLAPTPLFFSPNTLGYDFNPDAPRPAVWLGFLGSLWPDDRESIDALQEWFGYLLTPDTSQQKILMIVGPKRSGKGTIARVIRVLIGPQNVCSPTLSGMATNFGLAPLIGKTAAIFADARLSGRADGQAIVEKLLSISGEDAQTIDRKHLSSWTGNLLTRFTLISNELPRLGDNSGALPSRMVVLQLTRSFYGEEDTSLTRRLIGELPSILLWSIAGWARLRQRGHFLQPASGRELLDDLEGLSSPVGAFVAERCTTGPDCRVPVKDLYNEWKQFCQDNGREHPGDSAGFGRSLRAVLPGLKTGQVRRDGGRGREFIGIGLADRPAF